MTKRGVESDIDALNEEILADLSPAERHAFDLQFQREGRDRWQQRLVTTAPTETYRMTNMEYHERVLFSTQWAKTALYRLHTRLLEFKLCCTENIADGLGTIYLDEDDPESIPNEDDDSSPADLLGEIYILYHSYRRFAEEMIGVDFKTWLAFEPNGERIVEAVQETLEANPDFLERANETLGEIAHDAIDLSRDDLPDELPADPLDQLVLVHYQMLADGFDKLSLIDPPRERDRSERR